MNVEVKRLIRTVAVAAAVLTTTVAPAVAGDSKNEDLRTLTVTVEAKSGGAATLRPADFAVFRGDTRQEVVTVRPAADVPANVAVLIQEGLDAGVGHELARIKQFIRELPAGSKVMVGYLRGTNLQVEQAFTADLAEAADAVRLPVLSAGTVASAPFENTIEALRRFDGLEGRNQVVLVSSGLELNRGLDQASPARNLELDRAIREAQRRGIPIWAIYANAAGAFGRSNVAVSFGQSSLSRLAEETGGRAFFAGRGFVTFDHPLREIRRSIDNQYLLAFRPAGRGELEVDVEASGMKVRHADR